LKTSPKGKRTTFPKVLIGDIRNFPIKSPTTNQELLFTEKINTIVGLTNSLINFQNRIVLFLKNKLDLGIISNNLLNWDTLEYKDFIKELQKANVKLSLSEEADWMNYFNEQKQKAQTLKSEIEKTDREIDRMVYELYGLTEEEIKIVEGA
jgi:hypothetical protein